MGNKQDNHLQNPLRSRLFEPSAEPSAEEPSAEEPSSENQVDIPEVDTTPQNPKRGGCGYVVHSKMEYFLILIPILLYRRRL